MSTQPPAFKPADIPADARIAIAAARFNQEIVDELLSGCVKRLEDHGIARERLTVQQVPGAFELPLAAKLLAQTKRYAAVVCVGAVVRGETPHFDYVAGECARGVQQVGLDTGVPVAFGVLTTETMAQALDRAGGKHGNKGWDAAMAAMQLASVQDQVPKEG